MGLVDFLFFFVLEDLGRGGETFESLRKMVGVKDAGIEISGPGSAVRLASKARGDLSRGLRRGGRNDGQRARALGVRLFAAEPEIGASGTGGRAWLKLQGSHVV